MHAILTVAVTQCDPGVWGGNKTVISSCALPCYRVLYAASTQPFFFWKAQTRIVAFYTSGSQLPLGELHAIN